MVTRGRLTRRQFLWRASATTIAIPSLAQVLAACGSDDPTTDGSTGAVTLGSPDAPKALPTSEDNPPIASGLPPEAGPLTLFTLADYVPGPLIKDFEREFGVSVEALTYSTPDEGLRKVASGEIPFDLYDGYVDQLPALTGAKLVAPVNHDYIPNLANIWDTLQDPWYDPGAVYTIASVVGAFGVGWRTDMFDVDVAGMANPWDAMWDPKAKNIVAFQDQFREAIAMSLFHNGEKDPNDPSDAALSAAVDGLKTLIQENGARVGTDVGYVGLGEGTYGVVQSWAGDSQYAAYSMPKGADPSVLQYVWPPASTDGAVGGTVSADFWMVNRSAKNPVLAHNFIDWVLGKEQAQKWYKLYGLQLPQKDLTPETVVSLGLVPEQLSTQCLTPDDFDLGQWILPLSEGQQQRLVDAWSEVQRG
jgi:spermidine/putrescine transport system substrate-binding protein